MKPINFFLFIGLLASGSAAFAYPEFVAFGYSSCLTCHYNGQGGGALNDYGRALWSAEIASKALVGSDKTDEQLGNSSGFLGSTPLPDFIRPELDFRGLRNEEPLGGKNDSTQFYYMQIDANLVLKFDDERYVAYFTEGFRPTPDGSDTAVDPSKEKMLNRYLPREYWLRFKINETYWVYAGLMDKAFGIRNVDHTSYARVNQGFTQYDQSESVMLHKVEPKWEFTAQAFGGNPDEDSMVRQKGGSLVYEIEPVEKHRVAFSYLYSKASDLESYQMGAVSFRLGLAKGTALLMEYGVRDHFTAKDPNTFTTNRTFGSWESIEFYTQMLRGYNLHSIFERFNDSFSSSSQDQWKWEFGFVMFPMARLELRTDLVLERVLQDVGTTPDDWSFQSQIHITL